MNSNFDICYEVINPITQKTDFITEDRFIAETHYEKGYTVYERHIAVTRLSRFSETRSQTSLLWHDEDANANYETEEV